MEQQQQQQTQCLDKPEPVRSRWTPKPEQILILESIFNSGMVNPPKEETVKIRKMLEKFGSVGDANVFYWFQNRRSRSRRRQRQIQATLITTSGGGGGGGGSGGEIQYTAAAAGLLVPQPSTLLQSSSSVSTSRETGADEFFPFSGQLSGFTEIEPEASLPSTSFQPFHTPNLHYDSGIMRVFINGVITEVERGPVNLKVIFGDQDTVLLDSCGVPVPLDEYGIWVQGFQHAHTYFLVSRSI